MSVFRSALSGVAWFAAGSWVQLALSLVSFIVVVRHVEPALVGAFNAGATITAFIDMVVGPSLSLSLSQRASIERRHIDATFWIGLAIALILVTAICLTGKPILAAMGAPRGWPLLVAIALAWPVAIVTSLLTSLLTRDLRFAEQGRIAMLAGVLGSTASIATIASGGGVWALVVGEMTFRLAKFIGVARAMRYRPGPPSDLRAFGDLLSFNLMTLLTLVLSYVDLAVPRLLTSYLLGPAALGFLSLALRCLDLLSQLTLYPISQVMMVSVARLNHDLGALRQLIRNIYRVATGVAYPAFFGAIMLAPHLVWLVGEQWRPAIPSMQILLLVGLRNATGLFNTGILQGTGRLGGSAAMLAIGIVLQLLFLPVGTHWGLAGVASAMLLRSLATWPLGCWLVRRASGLPIGEQLRTSRSALLAGAAMCAGMLAIDPLFAGTPDLISLIGSACVGSVIYAAMFLMLDRQVRRGTFATVRDLVRGDLSAARMRFASALNGSELSGPTKASI